MCNNLAQITLVVKSSEVHADPASLASASSRPSYLLEPSGLQVLWLDEPKELIQSTFEPGHGKANGGVRDYDPLKIKGSLPPRVHQRRAIGPGSEPHGAPAVHTTGLSLH